MQMDLKRTLQRLIRRFQTKEARDCTPAPLRNQNDVVKKLPKTYQEAAQSLTNWPVVRTVDHKNKKVKTSRENSHPDIVTFYRKFQAELENRGIPLYAFEFYRSNVRQDRLREMGVSKAAAEQSPHNWGCAVDMVHSTLYWDLTPKQWAVIGAIGKEVARKLKIKVVWGGDWKFYDPAHWELAHWRDLRKASRQMQGEGTLPDDDLQKFIALETRAKANKEAEKAARR